MKTYRVGSSIWRIYPITLYVCPLHACQLQKNAPKQKTNKPQGSEGLAKWHASPLSLTAASWLRFKEIIESTSADVFNVPASAELVCPHSLLLSPYDIKMQNGCRVGCILFHKKKTPLHHGHSPPCSSFFPLWCQMQTKNAYFDFLFNPPFLFFRSRRCSLQ